MNTNKPSAFLIELLTAAHVPGTPYITFRDFLSVFFENIGKDPMFADLKIHTCYDLIPDILPASRYDLTVVDPYKIYGFKVDLTLRELLDNTHTARHILQGSGKKDDEAIEKLALLKGLTWMNERQESILMALSFPFEGIKTMFWGNCPISKRVNLHNEELLKGKDDVFMEYVTKTDWINLYWHCNLRGIYPETLQKTFDDLIEDGLPRIDELAINDDSPANAAAFINLFNIPKGTVLKHLLP